MLSKKKTVPAYIGEASADRQSALLEGRNFTRKSLRK